MRLSRLLTLRVILPVAGAIFGLVYGLIHDVNETRVDEYGNKLGSWSLASFFTGLILGVMLVYVIETLFGKKKYAPFTASELNKLVVPILSKLMLIDGDMSHVEKLNFDHFINKYYTKKECKKISLALVDSNKRRVDLSSMYYELNENYDFEAKKTLIYILVNLAVSDRFLNSKEAAFLFDVAALIDFPERYVNHYLAQRNYTTAENHQKQERERKQETKKTFSKLELALKVLSLKESATEDEIKKQYRSLVKEFHPDKLVKASQLEKDIASEQFQKIQEAYEYIKEKKGIN